MGVLIRVENVTHAFKKNQVLADVSVSLADNMIHGFVGNNGSGKTLLFKVICGYLRPNQGKVWVREREVGKDFDFPPDMGLLLETPGFVAGDSAYRNLSMLWSLSGKPDKDVIAKTLHQVGLGDVGKKAVGKFSLGMKQRLGIAQAIMQNPSLIILDEPFNGLDKHGVKEVYQLLLGLKGTGKTILLASHMPADISSLCDDVYEMEAGKLHPLSVN